MSSLRCSRFSWISRCFQLNDQTCPERQEQGSPDHTLLVDIRVLLDIRVVGQLMVSSQRDSSDLPRDCPTWSSSEAFLLHFVLFRDLTV